MHHDLRAHLHPVVEVDHVLVQHPEAARRGRPADRLRGVGAVDAIARVGAAEVDVERPRPERVADPARAGRRPTWRGSGRARSSPAAASSAAISPSARWCRRRSSRSPRGRWRCRSASRGPRARRGRGTAPWCRSRSSPAPPPSRSRHGCAGARGGRPRRRSPAPCARRRRARRRSRRARGRAAAPAAWPRPPPRPARAPRPPRRARAAARRPAPSRPAGIPRRSALTTAARRIDGRS